MSITSVFVVATGLGRLADLAESYPAACKTLGKSTLGVRGQCSEIGGFDGDKKDLRLRQ